MLLLCAKYTGMRRSLAENICPSYDSLSFIQEKNLCRFIFESWALPSVIHLQQNTMNSIYLEEEVEGAREIKTLSIWSSTVLQRRSYLKELLNKKKKKAYKETKTTDLYVSSSSEK